MRTPVRPWKQLSKHLGVRPLVSSAIAGEVPLHAERYFLHKARASIPPMQVFGFATHLGGASASEGRPHGSRFDYIPSLSVMLPPGTSTDWLFGGAIDFSVFYFTDPASVRLQLARRLRPEHPFPFSDPLVSAAARQVVDELRRGTRADRPFIEALASVMVKQVFRVVAGTAGSRLDPATLHLGRLTKVLDWIGTHLHESLSIATLSNLAGVSSSHFRRVFVDAMGVAPHRYVRELRLQRASELLTQTGLPIAHIASECGFHSQSHLTACFGRAQGLTPSRFRRHAARLDRERRSNA